MSFPSHTNPFPLSLHCSDRFPHTAVHSQHSFRSPVLTLVLPVVTTPSSRLSDNCPRTRSYLMPTSFAASGEAFFLARTFLFSYNPFSLLTQRSGFPRHTLPLLGHRHRLLYLAASPAPPLRHAPAPLLERSKSFELNIARLSHGIPGVEVLTSCSSTAACVLMFYVTIS